VSNPRAVRERSRFFTGGRFTHNAWPTRDGRYVFTTDERPGRPVVRDPERPTLVGSFDTHPAVAPDFAGVWGAYIFPGSDLVLASDMQGGLFVLRTGRQ
jgi:hypothetical protein